MIAFRCDDGLNARLCIESVLNDWKWRIPASLHLFPSSPFLFFTVLRRGSWLFMMMYPFTDFSEQMNWADYQGNNQHARIHPTPATLEQDACHKEPFYKNNVTYNRTQSFIISSERNAKITKLTHA